MQIRITETESELANWLASKRYERLRAAGVPDELATRDRDPVTNEAYSYECELAVAKALNIYPSLADSRVPYDLRYNGKEIDVKWMPKGKMNIRSDYEIDPNKVYVGVEEISPWVYEIVGYIPGLNVLNFPVLKGIRNGAPPYRSIPKENLADINIFINPLQHYG